MTSDRPYLSAIPSKLAPLLKLNAKTLIRYKSFERHRFTFTRSGLARSPKLLKLWGKSGENFKYQNPSMS